MSERGNPVDTSCSGPGESECVGRCVCVCVCEQTKKTERKLHIFAHLAL